MKVKQFRNAIRKHAYENYVILFKGFIVTFGVLLAGWGQIYPHLDANTMSSKEAEFYLEEQYKSPVKDIDCASQPENRKTCRLAMFKISHANDVNVFYISVFSIMFGISIALLLVSAEDYIQNIKRGEQ